MMGSPWDGFSRRPLRVGLAVVCAIVMVVGASDIHGLSPSAISHPGAPRFLLALGGSTIAALAMLVLGLYATFEFARRRASLPAGLGMMAILAIQSEAIGALSRSPQREYYSVGTALFGWLAGLAYARLLRREPGDADEELAEAGCVAGIAGTYMNAAISKLTTSGIGWADTASLRGIVASHHRVDDRSILGVYTALVVEHPGLSRWLLLATLAVQAGAFFYVVSPTLRMVWGVGLLAFHTNVSFLTHIGYTKVRILLLLFSFPWPRVWLRIRGRSTRAAPETAGPVQAAEPSANRRAVAVFLLVLLLATSLVWLLPIRAYTSVHGHHDGGSSGRRTGGERR